MQNLNMDHLGSTILHAISVGKGNYSRKQHNNRLRWHQQRLWRQIEAALQDQQ